MSVALVLKGEGVPPELKMVTDSMGDQFAPDCCEIRVGLRVVAIEVIALRVEQAVVARHEMRSLPGNVRERERR